MARMAATMKLRKKHRLAGMASGWSRGGLWRPLWCRSETLIWASRQTFGQRRDRYTEKCVWYSVEAAGVDGQAGGCTLRDEWYKRELRDSRVNEAE
jgi:hypothetical protein